MSWSWHWWLFFAAVIPCTIVVQFTRGAMNSMNVARYGPRGDKASSSRTRVGEIDHFLDHTNGEWVCHAFHHRLRRSRDDAVGQEKAAQLGTVKPLQGRCTSAPMT
jgi:hypothetical protein